MNLVKKFIGIVDSQITTQCTPKSGGSDSTITPKREYAN